MNNEHVVVGLRVCYLEKHEEETYIHGAYWKRPCMLRGPMPCKPVSFAGQLHSWVPSTAALTRTVPGGAMHASHRRDLAERPALGEREGGTLVVARRGPPPRGGLPSLWVLLETLMHAQPRTGRALQACPLAPV